MTTRLPEKGTRESIVLAFDFSGESAAVSAPTFDITLEAGTDGTPTALLSGNPEISGAVVLQRVAGGVDQVNYRIQCTAATVEGDTLTRAAILPVRLKL